MSSPWIILIMSSFVMDIASSPLAGQAKVPLSNRFDRTQYPSSHTSIFRVFLALLQKMNIALPLGSRPISSSTMQERVLTLFLASVKPGLTS